MTSGRAYFTADNFDNYTLDNYAHYFSDDGGCFLVAPAPPGVDQQLRGQVLQQFVINQAGVNEWVPDTQPISIIGNNNWTDYTVTVDVRVETSMPSNYSNILSVFNGMCVDVNGKSTASGAFVDTWQCVPDYNEQVPRFWILSQVLRTNFAVFIRLKHGAADRADTIDVPC